MASNIFWVINGLGGLLSQICLLNHFFFSLGFATPMEVQQVNIAPCLSYQSGVIFEW